MRLRSSEMKPVAPAPWITPELIKNCTVGIISTAGVHRHTDVPFKFGALDYRLIPGAADFADLVVSHISTNFVRGAYQQEPNIWFRVDRLRKMAAKGEIGSVSSWHYSFVGAQPNHDAFSKASEEVGRLLAAGNRCCPDGACLTYLHGRRRRRCELFRTYRGRHCVDQLNT